MCDESTTLRLRQIAQSAEGTTYQVMGLAGKATVEVRMTEVLIDWLWVPPTLRAKGVGRQMLQALDNYFNRPLRPRCVLESALGFWARMAQEKLALESEYQY